MDNPDILIDAFPFFLTEDDSDYTSNVEFFPRGEWHCNNEALRAAWTDERRAKASELMAAQHPMPRATTLTLDHRANIAAGLKGNQNKTGKKGGNQYTNPRNKV